MSDDCKGKCKLCDKVDHCLIRVKEWHRNIDVILNKWPRPKGEGAKMAQEVIDYMQFDFMGGLSNRPDWKN